MIFYAISRRQADALIS